MRTAKAVLFDMDGVIFDSERALLGIWQELAEAWQIPEIEAVFRRCIGSNLSRTERIFREACPKLDFAEFDRAAKTRFRERYGQGRLPVKDGARELLQALMERAVPLALASSTGRETVVRELSEAGLLLCFQALVCGDEVRRSKPDPEIFLRAAEKLAVLPEDCFVIEDSFNGIRAAHAAGMRPLMVPDLVPPDGEMERMAERVFPSLRDIQAYVLDKIVE